ncbi:uncharacterized protein RJT21DRAFT_5427 [Scheffersomyces amazonensis]|uniref:uncharacterized protein n=1 Tax=Scheffersomyces amazonensis TaxID=1078765 RepID=UPI00315CF145
MSKLLESQHQLEIENLQKLRAVLQAVKVATDKIHEDIETITKINHGQILQESLELKKVLEEI